MQDDGEFEYRDTLLLPASDSFLLLPKLDAYSVAYILKSLSTATYPCSPDHHFDTGSNFICHQCAESRNRYEKYLNQRLFDAVVNGAFELWNANLKEVIPPPTKPNPVGNDLWYWVMVTYIYKSDLNKFCTGERIRIDFGSERATTNDPASNQDINTDHESSPSSNIDFAEPVGVQIEQGLSKSGQAENPAPMAHVVPIAAVNTNGQVNSEPPGKMPKVAIGKLAISAAWEIECEIGRKAIAQEVISRLQQWVTSEQERESLIRAIPHGVVWVTQSRKEKPYDIDACGKTLGTWLKSRA